MSNDPPTAVQAVAELQDTPVRRMPEGLSGVLVGTTVQLEPFQVSASVPDIDPPTAMQSVDDAQATEFNQPAPAAGLGVGVMRHPVPLHRSAKGGPTGSPPALTLAPTAVHADASAQSTPKNAAP